MKSAVFNAHYKYRVLKHGMKEKNVSRTCELFGISRATYYNWHRAYKNFGMRGLEDKNPKKPMMPNKVTSEIESRILDYVTAFPADGPKRIYYELKSEGVTLGETGIYNVLKRNDLTTKAKRHIFAKQNQIEKESKASKESKESKATIKHMKSEGAEKSAYPGHRVVQRIDFMGTFDGIGKIYQYSVIDTFSHWGIVKLYNRKREIDVWDFFEVKLVYLMRIFKLTINQLFTVKSKPFVPFFVSGDKYQEILEAFQIDHRFVTQDLDALGEIEAFEALDAFNRLLVQGFYEKIGSETNFESFAQVERAIYKFVRQANFSNAISSGINTGKTPAQVVLERAADNDVDLDTLPLWLMAVINAPKRETHAHMAGEHKTGDRMTGGYEMHDHRTNDSKKHERESDERETHDEEK